MNSELVTVIVWFVAGVGVGVISAFAVVFSELRKLLATINTSPVRYTPPRKEKHDR